MNRFTHSLKSSLFIAGLSFAAPGLAQDDASGMEAMDDLALQYQIDGGPKAFAKGSEANPFTIVQEIFSKSAEAAKAKPGQKVTTTVDIPKPEDVTTKVPPLTINTVVNADNTGKSDFALPAFKAESEDEGALTWEGMKGNFSFKNDFKEPSGQFTLNGFQIKDDEVDFILKNLSFSGNLDKYNEPLKVNLSLPMLKVVSEDANIVMQGLTASADQKEEMEGLKTGPADFKIKNIVVNAEGENIVINDIAVEIIAKLAGEFAAVDFNMGVDNVAIPANISPSSISTVSYSSNLQLNRLDAQLLADFQKSLRAMQQQGMASEMIGFAMMGKLMEIGPQLLTKSPEINLSNLNLVTDKGNLNGKLKLSYDGTKPLQFDQPAAMIGALIGNAEFTIAKGLLEEIVTAQVAEEMPDPADLTPEQKEQMPDPKEMANMQIQAFIGQGFLVQEGDQLKLNASLNGGQFVLNGQPMPLPF